MQTISATAEEVIEIMKSSSRIFDVVRLIDPQTTEVKKLQNGTLIPAGQDSCFFTWNKSERCANCISERACLEKKRITKLEFRGSDVYSVVSIPIVITGSQPQYAALEMINKVTSDLYLQSSGKGDWAEQVGLLSRELYIDPLTRVFNRRYYSEHVFLYEPDVLIGKPAAFLMIDIDHFKEFNDRYGYAFGDQALIAISKMLVSCIRHEDAIIRYGGDEFVIVLKDCSSKFLDTKSVELKEKISSLTLEQHPEIHPTISIGCCYTDSLRGTDTELDDLLNLADSSMYQDKRRKKDSI